jgi:hypothetical protein
MCWRRKEDEIGPAAGRREKKKAEEKQRQK